LGSKVDQTEIDWPGLRFQLEEFHNEFRGWFQEFVIQKQNFPGEHFASNEFKRLFENKPVMITDMGHPVREYPYVIGYSEMHYTFGFNAGHALSLERLGLLRRGNFEEAFCIRNGINVRLSDGNEPEFPFDLGYAALTPFGFRFYQRCKRSSNMNPDKSKKPKGKAKKARSA
jgi:hypothetical protein